MKYSYNTTDLIYNWGWGWDSVCEVFGLDRSTAYYLFDESRYNEYSDSLEYVVARIEDFVEELELE